MAKTPSTRNLPARAIRKLRRVTLNKPLLRPLWTVRIGGVGDAPARCDLAVFEPLEELKGDLLRTLIEADRVGIPTVLKVYRPADITLPIAGVVTHIVASSLEALAEARSFIGEERALYLDPELSERKQLRRLLQFVSD